MFSRVAVRWASRGSYTLPPIKFKHGFRPPSTETLPVITSPITTEGQKGNSERRKTNRPRRSKESLESKPQNSHKDNPHGEPRVRNNSRFTKKTKNVPPEVSLRHLNISVSGEVIYGTFPVLLALQAGRRKLNHLIYKDSKSKRERLKDILKLAEEQNIPTTSLKPHMFKKIFRGDQVHQGVCCDASPLPRIYFEEELGGEAVEGEGCRELGMKEEREGRRQVWLYLDSIQDPMNLGSILRSAYFMGVDRVLSSKAESPKVTSTVSKASAGVAEVFPLYLVKDPLTVLASLRKTSWQVVASASLVNADDKEGGDDDSGDDGGGGDGGNKSCISPIDVGTFHPKDKVLLIIGNEGRGISPELLQMCQASLTISPGRNIPPDLHCLNVSAATAILLHSLLKRPSVAENLTPEVPDRPSAAAL